jgi:DNA polymerase-3 subunit gamma/tau
MALALARKYRPKSFAEVAVQSHVSNTLKGAIARGRVAHGYLLCGPRGTGKTTLARVLAMALNCERRGAKADGEPCGECDSCRRIWSGSSSLDVVEIDAASNRSVDDARDLRERAMYAPTGDDRYKVYIVDEAHMLTREAWNALLKVLEEPPPRVVFVFATTEPQKIAQSAAPIMSRLQRFDLKRIGPPEIRERLAAVLDREGVEYEAEALGMIARVADGGLRDALSLADQVLSLGDTSAVTAARVAEALGLVPEDEYLAVIDLIASGRAGDVFSAVARLADEGIDFGLFLTGLGDMMRALLAVALGGTPPDVSERTRAELDARRERIAPADLLRMMQLLVEVEPRFRKSGQQRMLLETLLVRFALMDRTVSLEDVLRGLGGGGGGSASPASRSATPNGAPNTTPNVPRVPNAPVARDVAAPAVVRASPPAPASASAIAPSPDRTSAPLARRDWTPIDEPRGEAGAALRLAPDVSSPPAAGPRGAGATAVLERPAAVQVADPARRAMAIDVNQLVERWNEVVEVARTARPLVASALAATLPIALSSGGAVTIELQEANDAYAQALESGRDEVLAALRSLVPNVSRVIVRSPDAAPITERLTTETVRAERIASLARRDPTLGAAIESLDLELLE